MESEGLAPVSEDYVKKLLMGIEEGEQKKKPKRTKKA